MIAAQSSENILILYASQTGNAKYVSEEIQRNLNILQFKTHLYSMDEYNIENLPDEKYVVFIVSTTGQGEPPTSMIDFWNFLLIEDLPLDSLQNIQFALFGLGDSSYVQFNGMARKLYQRMLQLGASSLIERHLGDDQHPFGYDYELDKFTEKLYQKFIQLFDRKDLEQKNIKDLLKNITPEPLYKYSYVENLPQSYNIQQNLEYIKTPPQSLYQKPQISKILNMELLTNIDYERQTYRIDFSLNPINNIKYDPGDILMVYPFNADENVQQLISLLNLDREKIIKIEKNEKNQTLQQKLPFPPYLTIYQLFCNFLAIQQPPNRYFFKLMSLCTQDELHKEKLQELYESSEEYYNYVMKEKRNVYEILFDFNTVQIPLEYIIEAIPLQKHREFSISSSQLVNKDSVGITIGMVQYQTPFKRQIQGTCSQFLKQRPQQVVLFFKKSSLVFPLNDINTPVIMVGPGTGIAPFIGFVQHREKQIQNEKIQENYYLEKTFVIFGCRYKSKEFYYKEYLEKLNEEKKISLFTAFSRDQQQEGGKVYVQTILVQNYNIFGRIILENINKVKIFVSGSAKFMPKNVEEGFVEVLDKYLNENQGQKIIQQLKRQKQYIVEAW